MGARGAQDSVPTMRRPTRDFRDLIVWQRSHALMRAAYVVATQLPPEERYGLASQLRRAAASVPANIAEGHSRRHRREFVQFLHIARASLKELESHLLGCEAVGYVTRHDVSQAIDLSAEVSRMLATMLRKLSPPPADAPLPLHAARSTLTSRVDHAIARRNRSQS
jgi:four helix bundle protein